MISRHTSVVMPVTHYRQTEDLLVFNDEQVLRNIQGDGSLTSTARDAPGYQSS